ncbi:MAG: hypothetical protein JWR63_4047 [Conexibacter sp.]|nr:hypothetical protein [Conexibacter sp.]
MSDDEKDGIRGGELADEGGGPAVAPNAPADGIRGDGLAEEADGMGDAKPDDDLGGDSVRGGEGLAEEG